MASSIKDDHSEEEQESSTGSPSSDVASPETPTNTSDDVSSSHDDCLTKKETTESLSVSSGGSNGDSSQSYSANLHNDTRSNSNVYLPQTNTHQLPSAMLLPPYMAADLKPTSQATPESISLSNYVKLMTLQQGASTGGPTRYPMAPGTFHPGLLPPDATSNELAAVATPTTLPPQYQDMSYRAQCLLVNQAQQLGSLTAGFQHPFAQASQVPTAQTMKPPDDKNSLLPFQQERMQGGPSAFRSTGQVRRRNTKRPHSHSMEQEGQEETGLEMNDRGSLFPSEGDGVREERRPLSSDMGDKLPHQLKWRAHMVETWQGMCDASLIDLHNIGFHVETDKGFNFSIIDDSFVCQKKNHFQITVTALFHRTPKFVKMKNGSIQPIEKFTLNLHGIRFEQVKSHIQLEQSRSDRSKVKYMPDVVEVPDNPDKPVKRTICRLHFSETTQNNMRKRGKPNPDQKHFSLVVALHAETPEGSLPIVAHVSERIVVRASNPGNFDNDSDYLWYRCSNPENIFHHGRVGINTDKPDEALTVHGNIQVTGQVLQISDSRVKRNIQPVQCRPHLDNISRLQLYHYQLDGGALHGAMNEGEVGRTQVGLLAQEVRKVIPEAVRETNAEARLDDGGRVKNLLMVDKDQVLMETIGAVQELKTLTNVLATQLNTLQSSRTTPCTQCSTHIRLLSRGQSMLWGVNLCLFTFILVAFAFMYM